MPREHRRQIKSESVGCDPGFGIILNPQEILMQLSLGITDSHRIKLITLPLNLTSTWPAW